MMPEPAPRKTIARSLGECFGHIARGLRSQVEPDRTEVRRTSEVRQEDGVVLRRTVVEEVELKRESHHGPAEQEGRSVRTD